MYNPGVAAFLAIVRTQNLSRAAAELNLSQSAISKRLQALEQEVGITLLERRKGLKSVQLTPDGEAFIELAEQWDSLWRETQMLRTGNPRLSLAVATLDSVINSIFPSLYAELRELRPPLRLTITTTHSVDAYRSIERRDIDVAFSLLELAHANVQVERCYSEPMVVLRLTARDEALAPAIHPWELDANAELYVYAGPTIQLWRDRWWAPLSTGRTTLDTAQLVLSCMRSPEEWALVPYSFARRAQGLKPFAIQQLSEPPPRRVVYKLTHRHPKPSALQSLRVFEQCLDRALATQAGIVSR